MRLFRYLCPLGIFACACVVALCSCTRSPDRDTITVDATSTFQTIVGWEASSELGERCDRRYGEVRDSVLTAAQRDIGINRLRVEIRSGVENSIASWKRWVDEGCQFQSPSTVAWRAIRYATVNDNDDPHVIDWRGFHFDELDWRVENVVLPYKARIEALGEKLFLNFTYVAFTRQITTGSYHHSDPEEYAEFVLATYLHLRDKYHIVPDTWELVLEPDNGTPFDGVLLGKALLATARRLEENGFVPRFVAPSTKSMANALTYFDQMIAQPGVAKYLEEFSYHRYGGATSENLQAIATRAQQHRLRTAMLEWWFGHGTHDVLYEDLTAGRNSAWQCRVISGLFVVDTSEAQSISLSPQTEVRFNRQYFKYVRAGARRVGAKSQTGVLATTAFINPDSTYVVVANARRATTFTVANLPAGRYGINYTTEAQYNVELPRVSVSSGGTLQATIPASGVITIWGMSQRPQPATTALLTQ